jgi:hypothetical protein
LEREARQPLYDQMNLLREQYLPAIGFSNVFLQSGREADDLIAAVVDQRIEPLTEEATIVSADEDLYQLLGNGVTIFQPTKGRCYTATDFNAEYGIHPREWAMVKALAGCDSDNVPKIVRGLGVTGAIKYITGRLTGPKRDALREAGERVATNLWLTTIPLPGTVVPALKADQFSWSGWQAVCRENGLDSLRRPEIEDRWIAICDHTPF